MVAPIRGGGAGVGLLLIVIGTFLDWSRSGQVYRDSYQSVGLLREFAAPRGGPLDLVLSLWLGVPLVAAVCVVLYTLRVRRSAAGLLSTLASLTGTVAGVAVVQAGDKDTLVGLASTGPVVALTGSALALIGAAAIGQSDVAGVLTSLPPAESSLMTDLNQDTAKELKRLEIYKQDANPDTFSGLQIKAENLTWDPNPEQVNDHVAIMKLTGGKLTLTPDVKQFPLTDKFVGLLVARRPGRRPRRSTSPRRSGRTATSRSGSRPSRWTTSGTRA